MYLINLCSNEEFCFYVIVGGISVKEHFEINVIPLTVKISERFYNAIEKFFFPKKSTDESVDHTDIAHVNLMGPGSGSYYCTIITTTSFLFTLFIFVAMLSDVEESADGHVFVSHENCKLDRILVPFYPSL